MTLTPKDLEESEVKLGSRSKALLPESLSFKEEAEPEAEPKEDKPSEEEPEEKEESHPGNPEAEEEADDKPEDLTQVMRELGLDKRFHSPAEVMKAYRGLESNHSTLNQDIASLRRQFAAFVEDNRKPKETELDDDKLNQLFVDNPAQAVRLLLAKAPLANREEIQALKEQVQEADRLRKANEIESFKRSNPDYKKYEPQIMEWYNELPLSSEQHLGKVLQVLLYAAKGSAPALTEPNNKKHRAETSSGGKRKTAPDAEPDFEKMSLDELEERFARPQ